MGVERDTERRSGGGGGDPNDIFRTVTPRTLEPTAPDLRTRVLALPRFHDLSPQARDVLSPLNFRESATTVANIYGRTAGESLRRALDGIDFSLDPVAFGLEVQRRIREGNVGEAFAEFRRQVEADFEHRYQNVLTHDQIEAMVEVFVRQAIEMQINSTISIGHEQGLQGNRQMTMIAEAVISASMEGARHAGFDDLATMGQGRSHLTRLLNGLPAQAQTDALRAAGAMGFNALSVLGAARDLGLPQSTVNELGNGMRQQAMDMLTHIMNLIQDMSRSDVDQQRVRMEKQRYEEELARLIGSQRAREAEASLAAERRPVLALDSAVDYAFSDQPLSYAPGLIQPQRGTDIKQIITGWQRQLHESSVGLQTDPELARIVGNVIMSRFSTLRRFRGADPEQRDAAVQDIVRQYRQFRPTLEVDAARTESERAIAEFVALSRASRA